MSDQSVEQTVQSIIPLIDYYFINLASKHFARNIDEVEFVNTSTTERRGVSGRVLISDVTISNDQEELTTSIALKFFEDKNAAMNELKNAMELDVRFKSSPEFGIPKVIFASTQDPILIIYEGITGTNYDELEIEGKTTEAGRLLATIHGPKTKPVDTELYRNLIRMLGSQLSVIGKESEISDALRIHFEKMNNARSGTNPFSDYHQSNVMIDHYNGKIFKAYVIDPEFMQRGRFDRMEDVGTFFGKQFLEEYRKRNDVSKSLNAVRKFLLGYDRKNLENGGISLREMYPNGNPLYFFIGQWALLDALDIALNRGGDLQGPEVNVRVKFVLFLLSKNPIEFPTSDNS